MALEMETKIIYFVHGTTHDNLNDKCTGWHHGELSELGTKQCEELRSITKDLHFDVLFTSDLKRAIDSADITWPDMGKIVDERLRECNYGDYNGTSLVVYENHIHDPFPSGECLKDVEKRIEDFINFSKRKYRGKTIAIVAHRAPQLAFEVLTKNITWEEAIANDWRKRKAWQPGWEYII